MITMRLAIITQAIPIVAVVALMGCGSADPVTHPVTGRLQLNDGNIQLLAGSHVEAALTSDSTVRASGVLDDDGSFRLETFRSSHPLDGTIEGIYQVRVVLADDDPATRRRAAKALAPRFLHFKSSGLSLEVPARGDVVLQVSRR